MHANCERRQYGNLIRTEASRFSHELPQDDLQWELTQTKQTQERKQEVEKNRCRQLERYAEKK
jgi:ATP-dependent DNA helicase Rep